MSREGEDDAMNGREAGTRFLEVRSAILKRLMSKGGRPALEGVAHRPKIPLEDSDWTKLQSIASLLESGKFRPTPAQIASVILHNSLRDLEIVETLCDIVPASTGTR